jgi:hypothetical protein
VSRRKSGEIEPRSNRAPAVRPQDRENQIINAAMDLAEQQILSGTASAQVITHYLKLGSSREKLEQEKIRQENALLSKKKEIMESQKRIEELYEEALNAMRSYSGQKVETGDVIDLDGSQYEVTNDQIVF